MGKKGWYHSFQVSYLPRTYLFGGWLETYRYVPGWPSITLTLRFWHRTYCLHFYKMGED